MYLLGYVALWHNIQKLHVSAEMSSAPTVASWHKASVATAPLTSPEAEDVLLAH